jgi:capsular exopolysaccharide synthesis family protein
MSTTTQAPAYEPIDPEFAGAGTSPNLLQIAWRRRALIVLGGVIGCVLGALYYAQQSPVFRSQSQLIVIKKQPEVRMEGPADMFGGMFDDYLATHMVLIKSPMLVKQAVLPPEKDKLEDEIETLLRKEVVVALAVGGLGAPAVSVIDESAFSSKNLLVEGLSQDISKLPSFEGRDPVGAVMSGLSVTRTEKSSTGAPVNILTISFQGPRPEDCPKVLHAVVETYKDYLRKTYKDTNEVTTKLFNHLQKIHGNQLKKLKLDYQDFRDKRRTLVLAREGGAALQGKLAPIQSKLATLKMRHAELDVRIKGIQDALRDGEDPTPFLLMAPVGSDAKLEKETGTSGATDGTFFELVMKQQELLSQFGPDHPQVRMNKARLELLKTMSTDREGVYQRYLGKDFNIKDAPKYAAAHLELLKRERQNNDLAREVVEKTYEQEAATLTEFLKDEAREKDFQKEIAQVERLYDVILGRMQEINVTKSMTGFKVDEIFPPNPGVQVAPRAMPILLVALFCGLCGGLGLAWLAEVSDKSFRTPDEIRRRLGLTVVGHIPSLTADEQAKQLAAASDNVLDPLLVVHYRSRSIEAESFRGIRTAVFFKTQAEGMKVIQVTSPNKGDGKSTVTANLAVSIAQSGKSVLLIDADFRRPRQHKIFGDTGALGLVSVLTGAADLKDALRQTTVPNLTLLPCGPRPSNPAELLTSAAFQEMLDWLKEHFDYVLIDTPPLLAVSDPSIVAPRVDGVLLTIRISRNGRPHAERAKELLSTLNARVIGVVVNGISKRGKTGYDKSYGYNYSYNYGYSYTYSYESDENKSYYQDGDGSTADSVEAPYAGTPSTANGSAKGRRRHRRQNGGVLSWFSRLWQ